MNKTEFLNEVRLRISGLNDEDINRALDFYSEAIDDRVEEGLSEEQAVAAIGTPDDIAGRILMDVPLPKLVKAQSAQAPTRRMKAWEIVLIVLGSPVWLPIVLASVAVALALVVAIAAVILGVVAVVAATCIGGIAVIFGSFVGIVTGDGIPGFLQLAAALILVGLSILLFIPIKAAVLWLIEFMGRLAGRIKLRFINRKHKING